jgi:hypothetical protein
MSPTSHKSTVSPEAEPDDTSIPVLTERLTLPPLEFDTSLPMDLSLDTSLAREATAPAQPPPQPPPQPPAPPPAVAPALELSLDTALPRQTAAPARTPAAAPAPIAAVAAAPPPSAAPAPSAAASVEAAASHWARIELELRSSILQSIVDSLPRQVDAIVRGRMNEAIEQAVAQLAADTRLALAASLREIVDQAVRTELARLRGKKR